jgi:serine protease inhibitor
LSRRESKSASNEYELQVPRFEAKEKIDDLQQQLKKMGVTDPFTTKFDFSLATSQKDLFVSRIIHQVAFKADEAGTVASAATAVVGCQESCMMREKDPIAVIMFEIRKKQCIQKACCSWE